MLHSSPDRWCLALTVCVGVCQSEGQHHQSARCTKQPSALTLPHIHMLTQTILNMKASVVTNTNQRAFSTRSDCWSLCLCPAGSFVKSCKCAITSVYVYNPHTAVPAYNVISFSRSTASQWTWATPWPLTTQVSTLFTFSSTRLGDTCGTSKWPARKSTPISNRHATARVSSTTASWWAGSVVNHMAAKSLPGGCTAIAASTRTLLQNALMTIHSSPLIGWLLQKRKNRWAVINWK